MLAALRARPGEPCSGTDLSSLLGVSRAQIWKHVRTLRDHGYRVAGEPGGGYRLRGAPDRLYAEELAPHLHTRWLARTFHWLEHTDSTNRVAQELAREDAPAGTTVVAEGQTAGRGRLGRSFFSPPYLNLYTSVLLRPAVTTAEAPTLILTAAAAVAEAVAAEAGDPGAVEIKWPNDVLLGGRKTSGILMELGAEATRVRYAVLGIGVNLNVRRDSFPEEFRATATSLSSHLGRPVGRAAFAARLYDTLEAMLDRHAAGGFEAVRPAFDGYFRMAGRPVVVSDVGGARLEGTALGIDADGALRVAPADGGRERRVVAGDVTLRAPGGRP